MPAWCEQLLLDMAAKKQILVIRDDGSPVLCEDTIAPQALLIKRFRVSDVESSDTNLHQNLIDNPITTVMYPALIDTPFSSSVFCSVVLLPLPFHTSHL